jgi:hypothetical protein
MTPKLTDEEEKLKEEIGNLFFTISSIPDEEWYKRLPDGERVKIQPILDSIGEVVKRYYFEFLPKSKEEAREYAKNSYEEIKSRIDSIESEELRGHAGNYLEKIMKVLME